MAISNLTKKLVIPTASVVIGGPSSYGLYEYFSYRPGTNTSIPLFKKPGFATKYKEGSYGKKYGSYLADASEDSDWLFWDNQFAAIKVSKTKITYPGGTFFKDVSSGKDLRKKCDGFYNKETTSTQSRDQNALDELNLLTYCTKLSNFPSDKNSGGEGKPVVIDFDNNTNVTWWDVRNKEFYGEDGYPKIATKTEYSWFENKKTSSSEQKKTIKELCKEAYEMNWPSSSS